MKLPNGDTRTIGATVVVLIVLLNAVWVFFQVSSVWVPRREYEIGVKAVETRLERIEGRLIRIEDALLSTKQGDRR